MNDTIFQISSHSLGYHQRMLKTLLQEMQEGDSDYEAVAHEIAELDKIIEYMRQNKHTTLVAQVIQFM